MIYENSLRRTPIDQGVTPTILFKEVFPDYAAFQTALEAKNIVTDALTQEVFAYLQEMIGNAYMRMTTAVKNEGFTAWNWMRYFGIYEKTKDIFDRKLDELNNDHTDVTAKLFKVNRTASGTLEAKFLDNGSSTEQDTKGNLLSKFDAIEQWANRADPKLRFISNLALSIVLPLQPQNFGEIY